MKKLFVSALAMLAVALGFTACSSDEEIAQTPAKQVTVYASTEEPSAQRTALGTQGEDGTYPVLWEATDKIKIGGNVFTLTSGAGFSTGEFTGDALSDPEGITAYYPSDYDGTWPTVQNYVTGNIPQGVPMKATDISVDGEGNVTHISFKNEGGILRLNLTGTATVTSITVSATNLTNDITLNCDEGVQLDEDNATPFHIAVPGADAGTAYSGLKIVIFDVDGNVCIKTATSAITVQRSKITVINLTNLTASNFAENPLKNSTFDVGATPGQKVVHFTTGNLQYIGSAKDENGQPAPYWRIAESQYSYLGRSNYMLRSDVSGTRMPADADTDLFAWGDVNPPFLCSTVNTDYQPELFNVDGGEELPAVSNWATKFNDGTKTLYIEQGKPYTGITGEQYIVLSKAEWHNLFEHQYYLGAIVTLKDGTTVKGVVVCPNTMDETAAKKILGDDAMTGNYRLGPMDVINECALNQSTVDEKGLLFLPAAGYRYLPSVSDRVGSQGYYWSTTSSSDVNAYLVKFYVTDVRSAINSGRCIGASVRLASAVPTE